MESLQTGSDCLVSSSAFDVLFVYRGIWDLGFNSPGLLRVFLARESHKSCKSCVSIKMSASRESYNIALCTTCAQLQHLYRDFLARNILDTWCFPYSWPMVDLDLIALRLLEINTCSAPFDHVTKARKKMTPVALFTVPPKKSTHAKAKKVIIKYIHVQFGCNFLWPKSCCIAAQK